jgi:tetratricopeptide (TPR) repeat protein
MVDDNDVTEQLAALPAQPTYHPLYRQVEAIISQGNWPQALAPLSELLELYPGDVYLQHLLASARARSALLGSGEVITVEPVSHERSRGINLKVIGLVLILALLICGVGGAFLSWQFLFPEAVDQRQETQIEELRKEAEAALSSGDYDRAVLAYNELLELTPNDREIPAKLAEARQSRDLTSRYSEAIAEMEAHHWENALTILQKIEAEQPGYRDVTARMSFVQEQQGLESSFSQAEAAFNKGDYEQALELYEAIQTQDYGYQRETVQDRLFFSYLQLGRSGRQAGYTAAKECFR